MRDPESGESSVKLCAWTFLANEGLESLDEGGTQSSREREVAFESVGFWCENGGQKERHMNIARWVPIAVSMSRLSCTLALETVLKR
jgi:hypothetical protein